MTAPRLALIAACLSVCLLNACSAPDANHLSGDWELYWQSDSLDGHEAHNHLTLRVDNGTWAGTFVPDDQASCPVSFGLVSNGNVAIDIQCSQSKIMLAGTPSRDATEITGTYTGYGSATGVLPTRPFVMKRQ